MNEFVGIKDELPAPAQQEEIEVITLDSGGEWEPVARAPRRRRRRRRGWNLFNISPAPSTIDLVGEEPSPMHRGVECMAVVPHQQPAAVPVPATIVTSTPIRPAPTRVNPEPGPSPFSVMKNKWETERAELNRQVVKLQRELESREKLYSFPNDTVENTLKQNEELAGVNKELGSRINDLEEALLQANQKQQEVQSNEKELPEVRAVVHSQKVEIGKLKRRVDLLEQFRQLSVTNARALIKRGSIDPLPEPNKRSKIIPGAELEPEARDNGADQGVGKFF